MTGRDRAALAAAPQRAPVRDAAGVQRWTCRVCGHYGPWSDDHQWYGKLRDADESRWERLVVTCSETCRDRARQIGLVPADAELLA